MERIRENTHNRIIISVWLEIIQGIFCLVLVRILCCLCCCGFCFFLLLFVVASDKINNSYSNRFRVIVLVIIHKKNGILSIKRTHIQQWLNDGDETKLSPSNVNFYMLSSYRNQFKGTRFFFWYRNNNAK